jgi:hypothetical protein
VQLTDHFVSSHQIFSQSIAPAQSIAHGQIGDSISQKTKFSKNFFFTKLKSSVQTLLFFLNDTVWSPGSIPGTGIIFVLEFLWDYIPPKADSSI